MPRPHKPASPFRYFNSSPEVIRREVARVKREFGPHPGHVFNLGHGITPNVDPEHVAALVDAVHARAG